MDHTSYRFKIGSFDCIAIYDGFDGSMPAADTAQFLFKNAPKQALASALRSNNFPKDIWKEIFTCLVIRTDQDCVLLDTGIGIRDDSPGAGKLLQNLKIVDIKPDEVDTILISHAHGDHIGGITDLSGKPNFPRARYYMRTEEWDFWTSETTLSNPAHHWMREFVDSQLIPARDRFQLLKEDIEIIPGVETLFTPGHTPGNMSIIIKSGDTQLFYLGDVFLHPVQIEHPAWYSDVDILPHLNVQVRRQLLQRLANEHALVFAYHFDFPCLGYIVKDGKKYTWQPIKDRA